MYVLKETESMAEKFVYKIRLIRLDDLVLDCWRRER